MQVTRRDFSRAAVAVLSSTTTLGSAATLCCPSTLLQAAVPSNKHDDLVGKIGITTGTVMRHLSETATEGKIRLLDLPVILRDELDMDVLDLMSANLPSLEPAYLTKLRDRAERAGCTLTNLKMNQKGIDMGSPDPETRKLAMVDYKKSIDAAAVLGCRWARPLPLFDAPDFDAYVQSYRELVEYAAEKDIAMLIENFGWIQDDPDAVPRVLDAVGDGLFVSVDTGNWTDAARYQGLENAYPHAVTCDFKVKTMSAPDAQGVIGHDAYDLERCFQIGWDAGYRGPWFFEHMDKSLPKLMQELALLRDMIRGWTQQQK
tara:strand:+ start:752607 stop:753557 length:951 start_codon:yes stop_codon:yes gene_type:complete